MRITKLGHCCLIIEVRGVRFLTDPGNYTAGQNDVKKIDCVVVSHEHTDHLHLDSLKAVLKNNPKARVVANGAVRKILEKESVPCVKVADGDGFELNGVLVTGHGTKHAPIYKEYELVENTGYFFDKKLFYPGDAFYNPGLMVDILALPIAGPWCKISEAMDYALAVKPRVVFPVHDGNLVRHGITNRLPSLFLPKSKIQFTAPELNRETEF